ncbi:MAG: hypothetical protein EBR86_14745, partial [Planctomycetia bacterium]|nr:hypothetical protein [Planctomycetia bacterium]
MSADTPGNMAGRADVAAGRRPRGRRWGALRDLGMAWVLVALCLLFSALTWSTQQPTGVAAAPGVAADIRAACGPAPRVLVAVRNQTDDVAYATALAALLRDGGATVVDVVQGEPRDARRALAAANGAGQPLAAIATSAASAGWAVFADLPADFPALGLPVAVAPRSYAWPNFLKPENLLNIANQIAVIAILAVGMTLVILTGGIDLAAGSLIALSSVVTAILVRDLAGGVEAG